LADLPEAVTTHEDSAVSSQPDNNFPNNGFATVRPEQPSTWPCNEGLEENHCGPLTGSGSGLGLQAAESDEKKIAKTLFRCEVIRYDLR
jgi:hypothetical protein